MKKFKIGENVKPKIVRLPEQDHDDEERPRIVRATAKSVAVPVQAGEEQLALEALIDGDVFSGQSRGVELEPGSTKKGGLMFVGGVEPQAIEGNSCLMEGMIAAAQARQQECSSEAVKKIDSSHLVFVTPNFEEFLKQSGKTLTRSGVDLNAPYDEYDLPISAPVPAPPVSVAQQELKERPVDLQGELEKKIRDARVRYFERKSTQGLDIK